LDLFLTMNAIFSLTFQACFSSAFTLINTQGPDLPPKPAAQGRMMRRLEWKTAHAAVGGSKNGDVPDMSDLVQARADQYAENSVRPNFFMISGYLAQRRA